MTRPDTPPTPALARDVTARAAEHYRRIDHRKALIADVDWPDHVAKSFQRAGLLARPLPTRDELGEALFPVIHPHAARAMANGEGVAQWDQSHLLAADAVLALLRGESE